MNKRSPSKRAAGVQSVEIGIELLSVLAHQRRPIKISDLAARAGMAPAKAHRYLTSLVRSGYAAQDSETGLYSTGPRALDFSLSCLSTIEPIAVATREATALCRQTDHTVALSVWGSFGPTVVCWEQPARPVMVNIGLGSVFPLLRSATGRVFAAFFDPAEIERTKAELPASAATPSQPAPAESIEQVRRRGMARARDDFMAGLSAFAAPVFDHRGRMVLAMTVLDYSGRWDQRWDGTVAQALRDATARVSTALGHGGHAAGGDAAERPGRPARPSGCRG
ncbi:MAG: IclR family transcriptional regulator [Burkholderiaceae bacterium]